MEQVPPVNMMSDSKSPLASKTVQAAAISLVAALVGHFYPPVGEWMKANNEQILGVLSMAVVYGRNDADRALDWKNWTVKGFGFKF